MNYTITWKEFPWLLSIDLSGSGSVDEWRALNPDPTSWGNSLSRELRRQFPPKPKTRVSVRVDWRDYAPLRDGVPEMHYRFQVERHGKTITEDARAKDPAEAERIICEAFGWR